MGKALQDKSILGGNEVTKRNTMHRLFLKINAIFHNAIFGSGEIKTFNSTHKMCKVRSCIKTEKPVEAGWP